MPCFSVSRKGLHKRIIVINQANIKLVKDRVLESKMLLKIEECKLFSLLKLVQVIIVDAMVEAKLSTRFNIMSEEHHTCLHQWKCLELMHFLSPGAHRFFVLIFCVLYFDTLSSKLGYIQNRKWKCSIC